MSPIDPDSLRRLSPLTIEEDRKCVSCGYNLLGLRVDSICPECGRPIQVRRKSIPRYTDNLINAPKLWLASFAFGCFILFVAGMSMLVTLIILSVAPTNAKFSIAIGVCLAACLWFVASFIVTQPRPMMPLTAIDPKKEWRGLRWSARITQFFWIGMAALVAFSWHSLARNVTPSPYILYSAFTCFVIAAAGLMWLCVYISNIAFWGDQEVGTNFRTCAWMIGAAAFLGIVTVFNILTNAILIGGFWATMIYGLFLFFIVVPEFYLMYCLFQLQHMARWALTNHAIADAKTRRLKAQAERNARRGVAAPTSKVPTDGPIGLARDSSVNPASAPPERPPLKKGESKLRPRSEEPADPYDVDKA